MASIAEWIGKIKTAIYGEEVRGAIWQSLDAMNTQVDAINVDSAQIEQNKQNIATNTAAITALNSSLIVPNNRIAIPNNSDINTYTTPGVYAVTSDASASTMTNMPRNASGKLIVMVRGNNTGYLQQKYITTSSAYVEYVRNYNNGTWTAWEQLPTRAEVVALEARVTALENK